MPLPVGAIIAGAAAVAGQGLNAYSTGKTNRKTREFSKEMYNRQREHNLADYNMQNDYNSPTSQMKRLREAGLNPNLVYGDGASSPAVQIKGADTPSWSPHAPQVDLSTVGENVGKYVDTQKTSQEVDNLKLQNTLLIQEGQLKESQRLNINADTAGKIVSTDTGQFKLDLESQLRNTSLSMREGELNKLNLENEKISADTQFTLNQDERNMASSSSSLAQAAEAILLSRANRSKVPSEIKEMKARIQNINTDTELKRLDVNLKAKGIQPHDALYQRTLAEWLKGSKATTVPKDFIKNFAPKRPNYGKN